jgi:hypothetical protein
VQYAEPYVPEPDPKTEPEGIETEEDSEPSPPPTPPPTVSPEPTSVPADNQRTTEKPVNVYFCECAYRHEHTETMRAAGPIPEEVEEQPSGIDLDSAAEEHSDDSGYSSDEELSGCYEDDCAECSMMHMFRGYQSQ